MICRRDLGLPVKVIQLVPAKRGIRNRPAKKLIDHDSRFIDPRADDLLRRIDIFI
jgi:hypothetical protein